MKIYVDTIEQKEDLLKQSKYVHDFVEIVKTKNKKGKTKRKYVGLDSDKANTLMHIYMNPNMIIVKPE